jgi:hypothetical protein
MMHIAEGRLGDAKKRIDFYAWIDARKRRVQGYLFNEFDPSRLDSVCELFGLDKNKIKH